MRRYGGYMNKADTEMWQGLYKTEQRKNAELANELVLAKGAIQIATELLTTAQLMRYQDELDRLKVKQGGNDEDSNGDSPDGHGTDSGHG